MRVMLGLVFLLGACGGDDGAAVPDAGPDVTCEPEPTRTIFLNPDGGDYTAGDGEDATINASQILSNDASFSATGLDATTWDDLVACVGEKFAPFAVEVTDVDPGTAPHLEVVFVPEAEWSMTGLPDGVSVVSVATCSAVPSPVILYNLMYTDPTELCEYTAQSLATSQGLDHAFHCEDLLTYQTGCGDKTFVDMDVPCGETEARACNCGGTTQNSYQHLGDVFGFACE